jgi:hypothetical protein
LESSSGDALLFIDLLFGKSAYMSSHVG